MGLCGKDMDGLKRIQKSAKTPTPTATLNFADRNEISRELRVHTSLSSVILTLVLTEARTDNPATSSLTSNPVFGLTDGCDLESLNWQPFVYSENKLIQQRK